MARGHGKLFFIGLAVLLFLAGCAPHNGETKDPGPVFSPFVSNAVVKGTVNEVYEYHLETNVEVECLLAEAPGWMSLDGDTLGGIPWHISNAEVGFDRVKVTCGDGKHAASQEFDLEIAPGEFLRNPGLQYDHIQFIDVDDDGNYQGAKDVVLLCETDYCPPVFRDNNGHLERRAQGMKTALLALMDLTQGGPIAECMNPPAEIHLTVDSACPRTGNLGQVEGLNIVCDFLQDYISRGGGFIGYSNCLDPRYPAACVNQSTYLAPDSLEINSIVMHEYNHLMYHCIMEGTVSEQFCHSVQYVLSDNNGWKAIDSFCQLDTSLALGYDHYRFLYNICNEHSFDIDDMSGLFELLHQEYEGKIGTPEQYATNRPIGKRFLKCALDSITGENTYDLFLQDVCNNPTHTTYCSIDPVSSYYIDPNYCGW